jgi:polysaccharide pyruvyl transferase CsaB
MAKVLIAGYYGYGNTGDEAILTATVRSFRQLAPGISLTVLSADPASTRATHAVEALPRFNAARVAAAVLGTDLFVFGGGSLLQDTTSLRSLGYYLALLNLALVIGRPVMVFANGFGPICSRVGRMVSRQTLNRVALITLRDPDSARDLYRLGVNRPRVLVTADPAFLLDPVPDRQARAILATEGIPDTDAGRIVVSARRWPGLEPARLAGALNRLSAAGLQVVFASMHGENDRRFAREVRGLMRAPAWTLTGSYSPEELMGVIRTADLVLGMRLHSLIFAVAQAVPAAGIAYDPKVTSFLEVAGLPVAARVPDFDGERLVAAVDDLWRRRAEAATRLEHRARELRSRALENVTLALELLSQFSNR